ncbi:hypothetical protein MKW98_031669, partial [Papaver atlanticum]
PGPRETIIQCFIKRNRTAQTYYLGLTPALTDNGKFLLAARKARRTTCTDYIISIDADDMSKGSGTYIGKLRSNFFGTKFTVYDSQPPYAVAMVSKSLSNRLVGSKQVTPRVPVGNYPVAHIAYELNVLGSRGPRRMHCVMDGIPATSIEPGGTAPTQTEFPLSNLESFPMLPFFRSKSSAQKESCVSGPLVDHKEGFLVLKNKSPRWHEQLQCWCLNFRVRVTVASVKNFSWLLLRRMDHLGQNMRRSCSSSAKLERTCSLWIISIQFQLSRHLPSALAVLTPRLPVNNLNKYKAIFCTILKGVSDYCSSRWQCARRSW